MRALLIGGSGLLGAPTCAAFLAAGHEVTVLTRGALPLSGHPRLHARVAERGDPEALQAALAGQSFDFTVDLLAYNTEDVRRLFAIPGFEPGRVVQISTGQVYCVTPRAPPFREADADSPILPEPEPDTRRWHNWTYGMGKRAAEAALIAEAGGRPTLALRLPTVQGEADGHRTGRLWAWLERMLDGGPLLLPDDGVDPVCFVYSGDVAAALLRLAEGRDWPAKPALNLAQPGAFTLRQFLEEVARCAGLKAHLRSVPAPALQQAGLLDAAMYAGPWWSRPDPSAALALGFRTRTPVEYLPAVVAAHLADPPKSHEGYAQRAAELAFAAARPDRG